MPIIDLHTHTTASDGSDSPAKLLQIAQAAEIDILSITDHDTLQAYHQLAKTDIKKYYQGKLIYGLEIGASFHHTQIEILAFGFEPDLLEKFTDKHFNPEYIQSREQEIFGIVKTRLSELEYTMDPQLQYKPPFCSFAFQDELWKYPENIARFPDMLKKYPDLLYRYLSDPNYGMYAFDPYDPDYLEVIKAIHQAGGKAFLAHPLIYPVDDSAALIQEIIETSSIDGIEVFYSLFSQPEIKKLLSIADRHKLLVSGGSDYHGIVKPYIQIGQNCHWNDSKRYAWMNDILGL